MNERETLIQQLIDARAEIAALLPQIDPHKHIYPHWTIKELLAHMTGWDDAVIASLRAHIGGSEPGTPAARGINVYNAETVSTRETINYEAVKREWEQTRAILLDILRNMTEEKYQQPLIVPWGGEATVKQLVQVFIHHETEEHGKDLHEWLKNPNQPLLDRV